MKNLKKEMGRQSRLVLIYSIIMTVTILICTIIQSIPYLTEDPQISADALTAMLNGETPLYSIIAIAAGMLYILLKRRKKLFACDLRSPGRHLPPQVFVVCIMLFFTSQMIFACSDFIVRNAAGFLGYTMSSATDALQHTEDTWALLLYSGFLGPITEEILFRGVVLNALAPYGKRFAIITSSVLFAMFHGDITQGIFAFFCGLILGYVAAEYSIKWAIVLHVINNFVIVDLLGRIIEKLPANLQDSCSLWMILMIGTLGIVLLFRKRACLKSFLAQNKMAKHTYRIGWTSLWFLLYIALQLIAAFSMGFTKA